MCSVEAKSVTIHRMQNNLQEWDKQLKEIMEKKEQNGNVRHHYYVY